MTSLDDRMLVFKDYLDRTHMDHKPYQYEGVRWMLKNELSDEKVRGGFIADEMGLGKTIMMIGTFLCHFLPHTLILVPPVLVDQWFLQIYKTTGHKALIYHGEKKKEITLEDLNQATLVISTYGSTFGKGGGKDRKEENKEKKETLLHQVSWSRIVCDEAHHLRNQETTRFQNVKSLSTPIRWLVSGTPVQNKKQDFYSLCSLLGLPANFYTDSNQLPLLASRHILKRTKKSVGMILSEVQVEKSMVDWKNKQEMELSEKIHSSLAFSRVKSDPSCIHVSDTLPIIQLLRARQSCIYPKLMSKIAQYSQYKDALHSSSKLDYAVESILKNKGNGCGKLIFCHFREEIDEIAARLKAGGMSKVVTFDGRTGHAKRSAILKDNNEALVLQIQTGCEGLNLQENYSEIYFISPHWNPAVEDQAIARCHRIGQTKQVLVKRFEMCKFVDEEIDTVTIDSYIGGIQDSKRMVANEYIQS